MGRDKNFN